MAEGLFNKARAKGILSDVKFYYKLKSIVNHGFFQKSEIIEIYLAQFKGSKSFTYRKLDRLLTLGLIRKDNGYRLIKYDDLFLLLGYDMTRKNSKRLGNFKIHMISSDHVGNLEGHLCVEEMKLKMRRQQWIIDKRPNKYYTENLTADVRELDNQDILTVGIAHLSCRGVASLMGYDNNPAKGYALEKQMEALGLIKLRKRHHFLGFYHGDNFKKDHPEGYVQLLDDMVIEVLPNEIIFL